MFHVADLNPELKKRIFTIGEMRRRAAAASAVAARMLEQTSDNSDPYVTG